MSEHEELVEETAGSEASSDGAWFGRLIGWLARLLLIGLLGIALGVGIYLGVPALLRVWTEPVEANTAQIAQLSQEVDQLKTSQAGALDGLAERVASLEGEATSQREYLSELDTDISNNQESLDDIQSELDRVDRFSSQLDQLDEVVSELESDVEDLLDQQSEPSAELQDFQDQLTRLRVMTLLSRARLELLRSNYGLAQENLELARAEYDDQLIAEDSPVIVIIERLDLAVEALPDSPSVAAQDLEAAWRLLAEADTVDNLN